MVDSYKDSKNSLINNIDQNKSATNEKSDYNTNCSSFETIENAFQTLLNAVHPNPCHPELIKTPSRAAKGFLYLVEGYSLNPYDIVKEALFDAYDTDMVVIKNIALNSMCEHHLLPFIGRCDIGYIPKDKILGLSKFSRVVDVFARRLQVQERLTYEIADFLNDSVKPQGVIVRINSQHLCAKIRGVEEKESHMDTLSTFGKFKNCPSLISQFLSMIK